MTERFWQRQESVMGPEQAWAVGCGMAHEPALDRVPDGMMLSQEEWAFLSERSRRFIWARAAQYKEMTRLLAEREAGARQAGDEAGPQPTSGARIDEAR